MTISVHITLNIKIKGEINMKREKIDNIIKEFVEKGRDCRDLKTSNDSLFLQSGVIVNYYTIIGIKLSKDIVILNKDKYSVTTSKNQNKIRRLCQDMNIKVIEVPENDINRVASSYHDGKDTNYLLELLAM